MIGFFPDLRPDELLYSALARYHRRIGSGQRWTAMDLFGDRNVVPVVDLPGNLNALLERLPPGHRYSFGQLVGDHTLAPLYTMFAREEQRTALVGAMGFSSMAARARAGLAASLFPPLKRLRYCPKCYSEQLQSGQEPYWNRLHQVPWVETCPDHGLLLELAFDRDGGRLNRFRYFDAADLTGHFLFHPCDDPAATALAVATQSVLRRGLQSVDIECIRVRYFDLWSEAGLRFDQHRFTDELWSRVLATFGGVMRRLGMFSSAPPSWFRKFIRHPERSRSTWQHLLVLGSIGRQLSHLDEDHEQQRQLSFVKTCPNTVCPAPDRARLLTPAHRSKRPAKCVCSECGYTFVVGPKQRVIDHGPVWKNHLKTLWQSSNSTRQIAEELGCDSLTVVRHAHALGLKFPRSVNGRETNLRRPHHPQIHKVTAEDIERRRHSWMSVSARANGRKSARLSASSDHSWLRRNDLTWLARNLPQKQPGHVPGIEHDLWLQRESCLLEMLEAALTALAERGERLSMASVARELSATNLIPRRLPRMPKLAAAITLACKGESTVGCLDAKSEQEAKGQH